jgi:hypothetical protein
LFRYPQESLEECDGRCNELPPATVFRIEPLTGNDADYVGKSALSKGNNFSSENSTGSWENWLPVFGLTRRSPATPKLK